MAQRGPEEPKRERLRRAPLARVKFTIRLGADTDLDELRACAERVLAFDHERAFPDLIRLDESIWDHDPRHSKRRLRDHYVSEETVKERRATLEGGKGAGVPLRIKRAFERVADRPPKFAPGLVEERFAVLELPVFWRHYRRQTCKPNGSLFDAAYDLQKACGDRIKVTPALSLPGGGLQIGNLFPARCRMPDEASNPDSANWHLLNIRAIDGSGATLIPTGVNGFGTIVGHLDTGWTPHPELNFPVAGAAAPPSPNFPPGFDANTLEPWLTSAREPLPAASVPGTNPQHGTRTASMIVSGRDTNVSGVAPAATIFSVRCAPDVVILSPFLDDEMIATAIMTAVGAGAQVISMSLGGTPSPILHYAVRFAVASNVIVVAAAGNYFPQVVFPAAFPECIAVGGSTADDCHWVYSSRDQLGLTPINIAAPAEFVRHAVWSGLTATQMRDHGTSFATAIVAGAAALWLQFFGRAGLIAALGGRAPLQALFMAHLAATARVPASWNTALDGPGILNLQALLSAATLPNPATFPIPWWVNPLATAGAAGASAIGAGFNSLIGSGPVRWVAGVLGDAANDLENFAEEAWSMILSNPVVASTMQEVEAAGQAAVEAAEAAADAAEEIAEDLQEAAEEAAETATEAAEEVADAVADTASDALSTAAGWLGF